MIVADATNSSSSLSPVLPLGVATGENASSHLEHRLITRWDDLLTALNSHNFYIELLLIIIAIALAGLVAKFINDRISKRLKDHPPKFIDSIFITKPLLLLGPTLALLFLAVVKLFAVGFDLGGDLTDGIIELGYAYWLTKCVVLAIRVRPVALLISATIIINAALRVARVSHSTSAFFDSIAFDVGKYHISALHIVHGFIIFVVVFWGAGLLTSTLESYMRRNTRLSPSTRDLVAKFFKILVYVCALAITLSAIGIDLTAFAIFSGALGVGIGLGLQKLTSNFVSGVTVLMERSIKTGDLIEVGGHTGWVRQLNTRYVLIETSDGREVLIPNEELVSTRVINWTLTTTLARIEIKVTTSYDSDAEQARELLLEAALEHPRCLRDPQPTCWLNEFSDHGVGFLLSFWIADIKAGRNAPQSDVMFAILKKFRENKIVLAKA